MTHNSDLKLPYQYLALWIDCNYNSTMILGLEVHLVSTQEKNRINWTVVCVNEFARKKKIPVKSAFLFLYKFNGITFLKENYEAEHTLSFDDAVEDLEIICARSGGTL
jgi:hypothetical protein